MNTGESDLYRAARAVVEDASIEQLRSFNDIQALADELARHDVNLQDITPADFERLQARIHARLRAAGVPATG